MGIVPAPASTLHQPYSQVMSEVPVSDKTDTRMMATITVMTVTQKTPPSANFLLVLIRTFQSIVIGMQVTVVISVLVFLIANATLTQDIGDNIEDAICNKRSALKLDRIIPLAMRHNLFQRLHQTIVLNISNTHNP
jgi:hypothetical protein